MKSFFVDFIIAFVCIAMTSCDSFLQGMAQSAMYGYSPYSLYPGMGVNAVSGAYSSNPSLNAAMGVAASEQRLMQQGVSISHSPSATTTTSSSSKAKEPEYVWFDCCSKTATFGTVSYHKCPNCGVQHKIGSGHMCKKYK